MSEREASVKGHRVAVSVGCRGDVVEVGLQVVVVMAGWYYGRVQWWWWWLELAL